MRGIYLLARGDVVDTPKTLWAIFEHMQDRVATRIALAKKSCDQSGCSVH